MKRDHFNELWDYYVKMWLDSNIDDGRKIDDLCIVQKDAREKVYENYLTIKEHCKNFYFLTKSADDVKLNRFKRASVMTYSIIETSPLKVNNLPNGAVDNLFLKQRFAFYMGIITVLFDFKEEAIKNKDVFSKINKIGEDTLSGGNDPFVMSIYKDFLYAEQYRNFDILAIANVYGLIFEYVLGLTAKDLKDLKK